MSVFLWRKSFDVACTVEIANTCETLETHVVLDGDCEIGPGDTVLVHDAPTHAPFGERLILRRRATVTRAGALTRLITRLSAILALTELYEVSFTDRSAL